MRRIILSSLILLVATVATAQDRLEKMISPGFHPVTFEDPRALSEIRPIFVHHAIDRDFVTQGGDAEVYALQLRYALNDRFAIIATKDGYVDFNPKAGVPKDTGWANIEAGVKYAFYKDAEAGNIASVQLRYEFPWGDKEVLQGNGDGVIHPSVSSAFALNENITFTSGTGLRIPVDDEDSFFWDADAQLDYRFDFNGWSLHPLVGASLIHVISGGERLGIADEGQDFFNFGATSAGGENIITAAAGLRAKFCSGIETGVSYQVPFDSAEGNRIIDHRWTADVIFRF